MTKAFTLADRLRAGETVPTGWCGMASPLVAELIAREGYPCVTLDQQHGLFDMPSTFAGIAAIRAAGAAAVVRIPQGAFSVASRVLDAGAEGIVAPMINTIEDAKAFVAATKFPPVGGRSWGPARATQLTGQDFNEYLRSANEAVVTFAMIETRMAIKNVDAILGMPGIDAAFVGPSDLSITLTNGKTLDPHSKEVDKAIDTIAAAAKNAGKFAAAYAATPERALELEQRGFRFFAIASDTAFLRAGAAAALKKFR
jgi:4-hydroxy-2-oxoheptanedioate aldolase